MFLLVAALLLAGLAAAAAFRARGAAVVGEVLYRAGRGVRSRLATTVAIAALGTLALGGDASPGAGGALLLALTTAGVWLLPREREVVCGERGLRSGWTAVAFAELEEWRLVGAHLRYRLRGRWRAVEVPPALHPALRVRLEEQAGGLESGLF